MFEKTAIGRCVKFCHCRAGRNAAGAVYPGKTREIGIVFVVQDMQIAYFNLGINPIFREQYFVGNGKENRKGYEITGHCIGCGACVKGCPQRCIEPGKPYRIMQEHCLHCGNCFEHCPVKAIKKRDRQE